MLHTKLCKERADASWEVMLGWSMPLLVFFKLAGVCCRIAAEGNFFIPKHPHQHAAIMGHACTIIAGGKTDALVARRTHWSWCNYAKQRRSNWQQALSNLGEHSKVHFFIRDLWLCILLSCRCPAFGMQNQKGQAAWGCFVHCR